MTHEMTQSIRKALHEYLAGATISVWKLQNALTESTPESPPPSIPELLKEAAELSHAARMIEGEIARWGLLEARF
jgi:hypothetical protein